MICIRKTLLLSVSVFALGLGAAHAEEAEALPEVSVTANRGEATPLTEVGSAVSIITAEEIEAKQIRVVSDALRLIPGVAVSRHGSFGNQTTVRLRGSESNQTLVLIDGVAVNNPASSSEFDFGHLMAQDIERIEVLRGPQSALYGSDAVGGVINIVTRKGEPGSGVTISAEGGSMNTYASSVSAHAAGEGFSIRAGASGFSTTGTSSASKWRGNSEEDGFRSLSSFVNASYDPSKLYGFDVVFRNTDYRSEYDDTPPPFYTLADWPSVADGTETFARGQARLALLDGRWTQRLGVSHFRNDVDYTAPGLWPDSTLWGETTKYDYQSNLSFDTGSDLSHTVTAAIEYQHDEIDSYVQQDMAQTSYVAQYQLALFDALSLTGALRRDANDKFEDATTYRLTAAYDLAATGTKLRTSYGTGVKNPTINELYGYGGSYIGNPDLQPEKAKGWDVGLDQMLFGDRLSFGLTYFDQRISNEITTVYLYDPFTGVFLGSTPQNDPATSRHRGIEVEATLEPVKNLSLRAAYTYTHSHDANRAAPEILQPVHQGSFDIGYRFLDEKAQVNLGIVVNSDTTDIDYATYTTQNLGSYTLVNLAGSYDVLDNVQLYARVENLGDAQYEEAWNYGSTGRAAYAGVKADF
ncbi:MAG: TonB-dependent receptor [Zavarzinia sp.]|nr:TonB-dependent receptor [Zavarzinia sp.]